MAHQIHAQHHVDPVGRQDLGVDEVDRAHPRTEKVRGLFAVEGDEPDLLPEIRRPVRERSSGLDQNRDRGGVVVGAPVRAVRMSPEVIVVRRHQHDAVRERALAFEARDHVRALARRHGLKEAVRTGRQKTDRLELRSDACASRSTTGRPRFTAGARGRAQERDDLPNPFESVCGSPHGDFQA